jgi:hypothetical protein
MEKFPRQITSQYASIVLVAAVLCSFAPAFTNGWTNWDDGEYVVDNPAVRDLTWQSVKTVFSTSYVGTYLPFTILTYAAEYRLFQFDPLAYHTTNILLHCLNTLLVFWLTVLLSRSTLAGCITAFLFAVHPMHVEPVAWISGRKDILSTAFSLGTLIAYIKYSATGKLKYLVIALLLFLSAILSKALVVSLALIIFLFDYYLDRRLTIRTLAEKIPFLLFALLGAVIAVMAQRTGHAIRVGQPVIDNILIASHGLIFYLVKLFLPIGLSARYGYPERTGGWLPVEYYIAPIIVCILAYGILRASKRSPLIPFGSLFFLITVLPVLQLIPLGSAIAADRYTYVPYIGLFYIVGVVSDRYFFTRKNTPAATIARTGFVTVGIILMILTWNRCHIWENNATLRNDINKSHSIIY